MPTDTPLSSALRDLDRVNYDLSQDNSGWRAERTRIARDPRRTDAYAKEEALKDARARWAKSTRLRVGDATGAPPGYRGCRRRAVAGARSRSRRRPLLRGGRRRERWDPILADIRDLLDGDDHPRNIGVAPTPPDLEDAPWGDWYDISRSTSPNRAPMRTRG
jgi:hypothetical protein